ncbi:hypothetical protein SmJEL517_g02201 [Synchytrium microbalum]|uniref:Uncharacterized protein n=1 Tax=Synchytrium microbalum TaxID=1806994 RepID=A0A507CCS0_9FUNG|nr:uncharacterized protein SmJEL517_g02201 [Synchytrium microbalum]TPX35355.1 hypothetical protein SmJEL517_g02201 [Synchytrium microbalum]
MTITKYIFSSNIAFSYFADNEEVGSQFQIDATFGSKFLVDNEGNCEIIQLPGPTQIDRRLRDDYPLHVSKRWEIHDQTPSSSNLGRQLYEITGWSLLDVEDTVASICKSYKESLKSTLPAGAVVKEVITSGPSSNRIDVVFMGDGYTKREEKRFFKDIDRLVKEMWRDTTFASTRPLFNVWAVYIPSQESGIGVGGTPLSGSPFGLYRDGTELRGIYCSKPGNAREACKLTGQNACDFPSLIANDNFYGGLGGEFTISTRSKTSGTVVLRHEMGHNFVEVGEEYDGGYVYSGCNSAKDLKKDLKWSHWLSDGVELNAQLIQAYPWYDMAKGPYTLNFTSAGNYSRWLLRFSISGVDKTSDMDIIFDGKKVKWTSLKTLDRSFYDVVGDTGFASGQHSVQYRVNDKKDVDGEFKKKKRPIMQLCSVSLHEFKGEPEFHMNNSWISAYPTYSIEDKKVYRPTNEGCLMRDMSLNHFCKVCQEGLWMDFLARISLIDSITSICTGNHTMQIKLSAVPLAQYRIPTIPGESYSLTWKHKGVPDSAYNDLYTFGVTLPEGEGSWEAQLVFTTLEVRKDPGNLLTSRRTIRIDDDPCIF